MSPRGALVVGLATLLVLGAGAAWLLNIPPLAIAAFLVFGLAAIRWIIRRARQKTEA